MADPYADDTVPEQPTGRDAIVAAMMSPQQRFNLARQGIDTGPDTPTPEEIEAVRARTANTRGLASQGWEAGTQPIIPYDWATQENMPNSASGILHNIATMPAAAADTMLRGARGAYLGGVGALAGGAGDLGLEPHPDQLARAIPEGLNVLGAATAQPEFGMLPRFPAAARFATKYPGEVMGDLAAPYAKAFESAYQAVPEGVGAMGGRLKQPGMGSAAEGAAEFTPQGALRAWQEPPPRQPPILGGDPRFRGSMNPLDEEPFTFNGKNPNQWTPEEFKQVGDHFGVPNLGPLSPLQTFKDSTGRDITIPGGLNDKFTYYDLLHLKAQGINAAELPMDLHVPLQQKIMRTMTPEPSDAQNWSGLMFGLTSPNNPLFPNQLAQSRMRLRDPGMMGQLADMIPWQAGDVVNKDVRNAASNSIATQLGLNAASEGGLGVRGSQNYTRVAELAQMFNKNPDFFRKTADEPWGQFVERLSSQVPGLQMKTGSFGSVWQDPAQAGISAVDRHMVSEYEKSGGLFPTPEAQSVFEQQAIGRWNNSNPQRKVDSFDQLQRQSGWDGFRNKMLLEEVGNAPTRQFRMAGGEINPDIPPHLQNAPWVVEPKKVQMMSAPYQGALDWNATQAAQQGLPLFPSQWLMWDRIRNRLEPHENMFPGLENMPAMSRDQLRAVVNEHRASGHMNYTKVDAQGRRLGDIPDEEMGQGVHLQPTKPRPNPARFGYFAVPPAAALGVGSALDDEGK